MPQPGGILAAKESVIRLATCLSLVLLVSGLRMATSMPYEHAELDRLLHAAFKAKKYGKRSRVMEEEHLQNENKN